MVGTLDYGPVRVATGTMGYKHTAADRAAIKAALEAPNFLLKIVPHVDGSPRICELVEYYLEDANYLLEKATEISWVSKNHNLK